MFPSFSFTVSDAAPKIFPKKPLTASSPFFTVSFIFVMVSLASMPMAEKAPPIASRKPEANPPIKERMALNPFSIKFLKSPTAAEAKSIAPEKSPLNKATTAFTTLVTKDTKLEKASISGVSADKAPCIAPANVEPSTTRTTAPTFSSICMIGCTACHSSLSLPPRFCKAGCIDDHACMTADFTCSNSPFQKFRKASDLFHRTTKAATSATIPTITHVMGDARKAVFIPNTAVFTSPMAFFADRKSFPMLPTTPITLPAIARNTPSFRAMFIMLCTVS